MMTQYNGIWPLCKEPYKKEELTKFGHTETYAQRHLKFQNLILLSSKSSQSKDSDVKYYLCHQKLPGDNSSSKFKD